ncbi:hypothetical protein [Pseudonocardia sp. MH-G8]|uniref:hypothetical protein n=1 Tax=Pseudonocardia sp. MH-G8 TaxID=1854588 RepID=UPI0013041BD9|nr:hypothetical protein [Pseudonocardia sp. MH-G8]
MIRSTMPPLQRGPDDLELGVGERVEEVLPDGRDVRGSRSDDGRAARVGEPYQ